jgi:hypothetical protein
VRSAALTIALMLSAACSKPESTPVRRANLSRTGGTTFEILPTDSQQPYCLAYTVNRSGLTRLLTMSQTNQSFECAANRPIGGHAFKTPLNEGPVRVYLFFSSQRINAGSVSEQLLESPDRQALSLMSMRLPGNVALEALDFAPEEDVAPSMGEVLGEDAGIVPDGGAL